MCTRHVYIWVSVYVVSVVLYICACADVYMCVVAKTSSLQGCYDERSKPIWRPRPTGDVGEGHCARCEAEAGAWSPKLIAHRLPNSHVRGEIAALHVFECVCVCVCVLNVCSRCSLE